MHILCPRVQQSVLVEHYLCVTSLQGCSWDQEGSSSVNLEVGQVAATK